MHLTSSIIAKDLSSIPLQRYVFSPSCTNRAGLRVSLRLLRVRLIPPAPNTYRPWLITGQRPGVLRQGTQAQFILLSCNGEDAFITAFQLHSQLSTFVWLISDTGLFSSPLQGRLLWNNPNSQWGPAIIPVSFSPLCQNCSISNCWHCCFACTALSQHFLLPGLSATAAVSMKITRTDCSINRTRNFALSRSQTGLWRFQVLN